MGRRDQRRRRRARKQATTAAGPVQREPRSRWRPGYWLRHPALCVLLAGCYAVTVVSCGVGSLITRHNLRERGETTQAVVEWVPRSKSSMSVQILTPDGEAVSAYVSVPADRPEPGDWITVVYDPEDPSSAHLPGDAPTLWNSALIFSIGIVPTTLYGWYLWVTWHRWRNQAERWRHRRPVPRLGTKQDVWRTEKRDDSLP